MNKSPKSRYAMTVDLDKCNGCGSCVVACAVENNVPPPTADANSRTGISWLRVSRMEVNGRAHFIPVMCQQCEHETPCASVCPQNAVELDSATGIVGQISQRCLGCRYCMAACPYHARSFNWWDPQWPAGMERTLNPQVSTRARGTVEKCNFCHGRWHAAMEKAAVTGERVEYTPACVEACPTKAMQFTDLMKTHEPEGFRLLASLETGAKVYYRTANPDLKKELQS